MYEVRLTVDPTSVDHTYRFDKNESWNELTTAMKEDWKEVHKKVKASTYRIYCKPARF